MRIKEPCMQKGATVIVHGHPAIIHSIHDAVLAENDKEVVLDVNVKFPFNQHPVHCSVNDLEKPNS